MIRLEADDYHGFPCPHCEKGWSIDGWDTEYGDPVRGRHEVYCSACSRKFEIDVEVTVTIETVRP
jgi:hypothetical protein